MADAPERGGAALGRMMAARLLVVEQEAGQTISPARLTRMIFQHLLDPDRDYTQRQTQRLLDGDRMFPDAEEVHAWCEALSITAEDRYLAFAVVGVMPPEFTPEQIAHALAEVGGNPKRATLQHLAAGYAPRAGTAVKGRPARPAVAARPVRGGSPRKAPSQQRGTHWPYAAHAGHTTSRSDLPAILCHGHTVARRAS